MRTSVTPTSLLLHQIQQFLQLVPGIRDGAVEAIHDGRVATRRIRELIPLTAAHFSPSDALHLERVVRNATSRLGRARDADVVLDLLGSLESAVPRAAAEVAAVRVQWTRRREKQVRRTIKALERMKVAQVLAQTARGLGSPVPGLLNFRRHASAAVRWEDVLASQLRERAEAVSVALEHAGGVLFPNRLHGVRIAMKKLRYAMEIAALPGRSDLARALRLLKKAQELLGRLHDHDLLAAALRSEGATRLMPLVNYQRQVLHQRYVARRPAIVEACAIAGRASARPHRGITARQTALVTLPLAALVLPLVSRSLHGGAPRDLEPERGGDPGERKEPPSLRNAECPGLAVIDAQFTHLTIR